MIPHQDKKLQHECFPQPKDSSLKVWRYLDLEKFIWLIENKKLYLSRLDTLNDPHEGTTPRLLAKFRDQQLRELAGDKLVTQIPNINQQSRKSLYINCWHMGYSESEAMWRLYCPSGSGVAIQTTYESLVNSIANDEFCYIGMVTYIDYESGTFPLNNLFYPVMHKRSSFSHENEVRLVKTLPEFWAQNASESPNGIYLDWLPESVIDSIYVNPYAPNFYFDVVCSVIRNAIPSLESKIIWSQMRANPVY